MKHASVSCFDIMISVVIMIIMIVIMQILYPPPSRTECAAADWTVWRRTRSVWESICAAQSIAP